MTRIHVTGNAGSGKTSAAKKIGASLDIPVYGLDQVVWRPGWNKTPPKEREQVERQLVSNSHWVIDGVSDTVRRAADIVILLDVGRPTCYWRCLRRNWRYLFHSRPELPSNCPEILIIPHLTKLIWNFPLLIQPKIIADMNAGHADFFHVKNPSQMKIALSQLGVR